MEMKNRDKAKQRIERQYQIVKSDATPEEIREVVNSGQEVQIFSQAVSPSIVRKASLTLATLTAPQYTSRRTGAECIERSTVTA